MVRNTQTRKVSLLTRLLERERGKLWRGGQAGEKRNARALDPYTHKGSFR